MAGRVTKKLEDRFTLSDVGSTLLVELAKGLYQPDEVIREYIQNAVDAHRMWIDTSGTDPNGPIQIEIRGERVSIMDYGIGMDSADIRRVKSIAVSKKRISDTTLTGHKGVGIWAGLSYFRTLRITSTKQGIPFSYSLVIDFKKIVDAISDESDIGEVLNPNYYIEETDAHPDEHMTTVTLEGPTNEKFTDHFLNPDRVKDAIRRICPCELYENLHFYDTLSGWYRQKGIRSYPIHVDGEPVYRSYPGSLDETNFETGEIQINQETVAIYWRIPNKKNAQLKPAKDELAGLRILQSEFAIGGPNLYGSRRLPNQIEITKAAAGYLDWYAGEVHVIAEQLKPNLRRQEFEEGEVTRLFVDRLRQWYTTLEREIRVLAQKRNYLEAFDQYSKRLEELLPNAMQLSELQIAEVLKFQRTLNDSQQKLERNKGKSDVTYDVKALRDSNVKRKLTTLLAEVNRLAKNIPKARQPVPLARTENVDITVPSIEYPEQGDVAMDDDDFSSPTLPNNAVESNEYNKQNDLSLDPSVADDIGNVGDIQSPAFPFLSDEDDDGGQLVLDLVAGVLAQVLDQELPDSPEKRTRIVNRTVDQLRVVLHNG